MAASLAPLDEPRPPRHHRPRHHPRHLIVAALLALAAIALASGGYFAVARLIGSKTGVTLANSQVFHWAADSSGAPDVNSLDPDMAPDALSIQLSGLIFDRLVALDAQMHVEDWGARSVAVSPDGTVYTFWLRPGQRFSDGAPVHASDYAYSLDRTLNPCLQSPISYFLLPLRDAQTFASEQCANGQLGSADRGITRHTLIGDSILPEDGAGVLTLLLAHPAAYFLEALAASPAGALDHHVVSGTNLGQDGGWTDSLPRGITGQGGSGMFYVARWDHSGTLVLKSNPYWWGMRAGKRPHLTEIDLRFFGDPVQGDLSYEASVGASAFDYLDALPNPPLVGNSPTDVHRLPLLQVTTIAFDWRVPPFDNLDARQAACLAINRDALAHDVIRSAAIPTWHLMPKGMPGYNPALTGIDGVTATTGDLEAARTHWAAYVASLHGRAIPPIEFAADAGFFWGSVLASSLMAQWRTAFPNVSVEPYEPPHVLGVPLRVPASFSGWLADYPDPQDVVSIPYGSKSIFNVQHAHMPEVDALLARADALYRPVDQPLRFALYAQAEQQMIQQVAICPILQTVQIYRMRSYVHGCAPDALGMIPTDAWVSCFIARH